jgi:hypothetical protein
VKRLRTIRFGSYFSASSVFMLRASTCSRVTVSTTPGVSGANAGAGAARAAVTLTACKVLTE